MSIHQKFNPSDTGAFIGEAEWQLRSRAAIGWLRRSIEATGGRGSAHSWHPVFGWTKAYPETTGYIIPTLLDYGVLHEDSSLKTLAEGCSTWLAGIQLPNGAFPGLLAGNKTPSVFNTSQILFGLTRMTSANSPHPEMARNALQRATDWLLTALEPDGSWKKHAFVAGFTPAYYTRAVWGVLVANQWLQSGDIQQKMSQALDFYAAGFLNTPTLNSWGFRPGDAAFTHTIAYTLEGFLESASCLGNNVVLHKTQHLADTLLAVRAKAGARTAGRYHAGWKGDYSFICTTGNAQLSVFFHRLYELTADEKYRSASRSFLREILPYQCLDGRTGRLGAMPGSHPSWGRYLPFRYPNWAAKFFLDALATRSIATTLHPL